MQRESKLFGLVARNKWRHQKDCLDTSIPWRKPAIPKKRAFAEYPDARTAIPGGGRPVCVQRAALPGRQWLFLTLTRNSISSQHHFRGSRWLHEKLFCSSRHSRLMIVTDNGRQFTSSQFQNFATSWNFTHVTQPWCNPLWLTGLKAPTN